MRGVRRLHGNGAQQEVLPAFTSEMFPEAQVHDILRHSWSMPHHLDDRRRQNSFARGRGGGGRGAAGGGRRLTCSVTLRLSVSTHSKASSLQQPPQRFSTTQDGMYKCSVSSGYSWKMSTRTSLGWHKLFR